MSLDSLAVETAKPHTNRLYRTVSRYHEKGDLPICTATRLSVSSMDLSQPSVAARKEFWEERAKSREPSHPCRNCQVAQDIAEQSTWLPLVYIQVSTSFYDISNQTTSRYRPQPTFPANGVSGNEKLQWATPDNDANKEIRQLYSQNTHTSLSSDWSKNQVRDFMDMTKNEEAYLASRPNSPPLKKGPFVQSTALMVNMLHVVPT